MNLPAVQDLRSRLGAYLTECGALSLADLQRTQSLPETEISGLGPLLASTGLVSDGDLARAYVDILDLPRFSGTTEPLPEVLLQRLQEPYWRTALILPCACDAETLRVATPNPEDSFALQSLQWASGRRLRVEIATRDEVSRGLDQLFGKDQSDMDDLIDQLDTHLETESEQLAIERLRDQAGEAPVIRLVNLIIQRAVSARASDIHIEAFENQLKLRYRVDGMLRVVESPPAHSSSAIISRLKLMARMNIAEQRLPQDGGFQIRLQGKTLDIRASTTPTLHGDSLVLRLLDKQNLGLSLTELGVDATQNTQLLRILSAPHGIILVTGPTGSGKTTTLYAALSYLNQDERKIMTVEDPAEYQLAGINQIQVKPDIGLDFGRALRSIVRQDPDIIMIGEMRDLETARTAVQSALTGHLVLSTLHTNDAVSAITRLMDMGIENYLVTSTVNAILAQRLVRRLCDACKEPYTPTPELLATLPPIPTQGAALTFHRPAGCAECEFQGYRGRTVILEIFELDDGIRQLVLAGADEGRIKVDAQSRGMRSMAADGLQKVRDGLTSLEEVMRVAFL